MAKTINVKASMRNGKMVKAHKRTLKNQALIAQQSKGKSKSRNRIRSAETELEKLKLARASKRFEDSEEDNYSSSRVKPGMTERIKDYYETKKHMGKRMKGKGKMYR